MNKNYRVITINGIRGIFAAVFIILGLIAGFVISPGWACMKLWNHFAQSYFVTMNLFQGIMLWAIIALSLYALNNKHALIGFGSYRGLSPDQIKDIMQRAKLHETAFLKDFEHLHKEIKPQELDLNIQNKEKEQEQEEIKN